MPKSGIASWKRMWLRVGSMLLHKKLSTILKKGGVPTCEASGDSSFLVSLPPVARGHPKVSRPMLRNAKKRSLPSIASLQTDRLLLVRKSGLALPGAGNRARREYRLVLDWNPCGV